MHALQSPQLRALQTHKPLWLTVPTPAAGHLGPHSLHSLQLLAHRTQRSLQLTVRLQLPALKSSVCTREYSTESSRTAKQLERHLNEKRRQAVAIWPRTQSNILTRHLFLTDQALYLILLFSHTCSSSKHLPLVPPPRSTP